MEQIIIRYVARCSLLVVSLFMKKSNEDFLLFNSAMPNFFETLACQALIKVLKESTPFTRMVRFVPTKSSFEEGCRASVK